MRDNAYILPSPINTRGEVISSPDDQLAWSKDCISEGKSYLRLQPAYPYIQTGLDMINGSWQNSKVQSLSDVTMELTIRNLKELVAAQTNIRIIPAFKTEIQELAKQRDILNKCFMSWQQMTFFDRQLRKAWQFACAAGTGYLGMRWDRNYYYKGKGDIICDAYGPLDVLPLGLPRDHNLQKAYAVTVRVETPMHEARRLFPLFASRIRASRENSKGRGTVISQAVKYASAALRRFGPGATQETEPVPWETADLYYHYIDDVSINDTGKDIYMGKPGTNWAYIVPFWGKDIKVGETRGGSAITRKAEEDDCLLYPNKRLIVSTDDLILTPDPISEQVSPYWHAKFPVIQLRADDWPWFFLGMPLTRAGQSLEKSNVEMMRGMVDSCNARMNPATGFDRNTMSDQLASTINTRVPGQRVGLDTTFSGPNQFFPFLPVNYYEFPAYIPALVTENEARLTKQMGVADAVALSRARQLPAGDTLDKILESLGPLIKDQSRNMEESIRGVGELWKSNFFQFISAKRRMEMIGPDGVSDEDFDYDPGYMVPLTIPLEKLEDGSWGGAHFQRARWHKDQFAFSVVPYSLHELNSITRKLFHLQLMRSGFPVDWWTLADLFDIKNFGEPPMFTDPETGEKRQAQTVMEKYIVQLEIQQRVQAALMQATAQAQGQAQGGGGGMGIGQKGPGRPPTGAEPPVLEQKSTDAGTRSTIRESRR